MPRSTIRYLFASFTLSPYRSKRLDPIQKLIRYTVIAMVIYLYRRQFKFVIDQIMKLRWGLMTIFMYGFWTYASFLSLENNYQKLVRSNMIGSKRWEEVIRFLKRMRSGDEGEETDGVVREKIDGKEALEESEGGEAVETQSEEADDVEEGDEPEEPDKGFGSLTEMKNEVDAKFHEVGTFFDCLFSPVVRIVAVTVLEWIFGRFWVKANIIVLGAVIDISTVLLVSGVRKRTKKLLSLRRNRELYSLFPIFFWCFGTKWATLLIINCLKKGFDYAKTSYSAGSGGGG